MTGPNTNDPRGESVPGKRQSLIEELVRYFESKKYELHGAAGREGPQPPFISNDGFGSGRKRKPDVIGFDHEFKRIVFGLVREERKRLDTEESLEEYNVFLDHNAGLGPQASVLLVLMPAALIPEFTTIITHYIHREYWHRIIPVASAIPEVNTPGESLNSG
jgi:hypothetical protein